MMEVSPLQCGSLPFMLEKETYYTVAENMPSCVVALLSDVYVKIMFIYPGAFQLEDSVLKRLPHMPLAEGSL